jgi:serine protease AprX
MDVKQGGYSARPSAAGARVIALLMVATMLFALAPLASRPAQPPKAHPMLLAQAAREPGAPVAVIVQKLTDERLVEAQVTALGGRVASEFPMIRGFAAELPARAIPALASHGEVRWISPDAQMLRPSACTATTCFSTSKAAGSWVPAIGLDQLRVWEPELQGQGITIAVLDSGMIASDDFKDPTGASRVAAQVSTSKASTSAADQYGHGSHIAGIIAGSGKASGGLAMGVAPLARLINVRVNDVNGAASASEVVAGLQWIYDNRTRYNIKVVNISLNSNVAESYHKSPVDAAVEILWFNKIVVVVSAGNNTDGKIYPPANDPFVITVGATQDQGTASRDDDAITAFTARGTTVDGFKKPELVAPGVAITSLNCATCTMNKAYAKNVATGFTGSQYYFKASGTSMAAAVTTGVVALLLQAQPALTPDQVKYRLLETGFHVPFGDQGPRYLRADWAITGVSEYSSNTGLTASKLLWTGSQPVMWNSVSWNSVSWNSVSWNSVSWNSVSWNSTLRSAVYWP